MALRRSRRDVAEVATARKRVELQIAELERQAAKPDNPGRTTPDTDPGDTAGQLAGLRRQHADLQAGKSG